VTPLAVVADEIAGDGASGWIAGGLLPVAVIVAMTAGFFLIVRRRLGATTNESVQAVVVLLAVAFTVLTIIGVWFRGEGMALTWPWAP
jgi:amino acid transporter